MTDWADETATQIQRAIIPEKVVGIIVVQELRRYIAEALRDERERCVKIADELSFGGRVCVANDIAAAIRKDETDD